jgi:hypothetical protein
VKFTFIFYYQNDPLDLLGYLRAIAKRLLSFHTSIYQLLPAGKSEIFVVFVLIYDAMTFI